MSLEKQRKLGSAFKIHTSLSVKKHAIPGMGAACMAKSAEMNETKLIHSKTAKTKRCRQCKLRLNSLYPTDPSHSENTLGTR
jgi:hypothetical protein